METINVNVTKIEKEVVINATPNITQIIVTTQIGGGGGLQLGETSTTAYRGDRGKTAYDHSQAIGNPHGTTATEVGAYTTAETDNLLNGKFTNPIGNNTQYLDGAGVPTEFPTIPSISGLATETYVDNGLANKVDKVTGKSLILDTEIARLASMTAIFTNALKTAYDGAKSNIDALLLTGVRLITSAEITKLSNTSGTNTGDNATNTQYSGLASSKQDNLTDVNFGAFSNALTAKTTIVDADLVNITDSADSNKSKKVTWLNIFTNYIKAKTDLLYRSYLEQFATIITSLPDTITLAQMNSWVRINVATDGNLTIPPNSSVPIPVGAYYYIRQSGVGKITLVAGAGVTLNSPENVLTTGSQYSVIKITKQATDNWMVEIGSSSFYNSIILPLLNNKVDKTSWIDYSATSTIVGFSAFTTKVVRYKQISDNVILVKGRLLGTSNSGLLNFTIPFTSANTANNLGLATIANSGSVQAAVGLVVCTANSNVVNVYRDSLGTAFTASGNKDGTFSILIEI